MTGDPEGGDNSLLGAHLEEYRKQSAAAYERNQAQITIRMLNNENRTVWTGSIFDAAVYENKDWELIEVPNGTDKPDEYLVKIEQNSASWIPWKN